MEIDQGYELVFLGKNQAKLEAEKEATKELFFEKDLSKNSDSTENMIIQGDNLEALKLLKKDYSNRIKMIYIDPPYNTGNKFIYNDNFRCKEKSMDKLDKATKRHSNWLSFMYSRLKLVKELLADDGAIFISIDDNEQANLKIICDEIFGEENFIEQFTRVTKKGGKSSSATCKNHDYILAYVKDKEKSNLIGVSHTDSGYKFKDKYFEERGYYKLNQTLDYDSLGYSKSLDYPIEICGETLYAGGSIDLYKERIKGNHNRADWAWRWSKERYQFGLENGFIEVKNGGERTRIYTKTYQSAKIEESNGKYRVISFDRTKPLSTLEFTDNEYSNDNAKKKLDDLELSNIFEYTKTPNMISKLLRICGEKNNDIILDFFAGSGTTAHAVMQQNVEDGGNRKFILVQLDEQIDETKSKSAYDFCKENNFEPIISSITIERVNRAGDKIKESSKESLDIGYKVFSLK